MEVSEGDKAERGNLEERQPSPSSSDKNSDLRGSKQIVHVKISQEIETVDYGAGISDQNVDTDLDDGDKISSQQPYDAGPSSPREQISGQSGTPTVEGDSSRVNECLGVSPVAGRKDTRVTQDPVFNGDIPVAVVEVGSNQVETPTPAMVSTAEAPAIMKKTDSHIIDVPVKDSVKVQELDGYKGFPIPRTTSNFSVESAAGELCRSALKKILQRRL